VSFFEPLGLAGRLFFSFLARRFPLDFFSASRHPKGLCPFEGEAARKPKGATAIT
jgi:hypothetical protein